jgi:hypothetical protein
VVEASLCWQCNNAYGYIDDGKLTFAFDARAAISEALYTCLSEVLPAGAA